MIIEFDIAEVIKATAFLIIAWYFGRARLTWARRRHPRSPTIALPTLKGWRDS